MIKIRLFRRDAYILLIENQLNAVSRERDRLQRENDELTRENAQIGAEVHEIDDAIAVLRQYQDKRVAS